MDRKKVRSFLLRFVFIPLASFFYFWGLNEYGKAYRRTHKESGVKQITEQQLSTGWKFHEGNDQDWAIPQFNDSLWVTVKPDSMPSWYKGQSGWFRLRLKVDSALLKNSLSLVMNQKGASEVYFDGEKIADFGNVSPQKSTEATINPGVLPLNVQLRSRALHTIAIRYSNMHFTESEASSDEFSPGFLLRIETSETSLHNILFRRRTLTGDLSMGIFLITLALLHFLFFVFYRKSKENIYYSLFVFCFSMVFILSPAMTVKPELQQLLNTLGNLFSHAFLPLSLILFIRMVFDSQFPKWLWPSFIIVALIYVIELFTGKINPLVAGISYNWLVMGTVFTMLFSTYRAIKRKVPGVNILAVGISITALSALVIISLEFFTNGHYEIKPNAAYEWLIEAITILSIPLSMSVYLAYNFALTNKNLSNKLEEVTELSAKTISQEKEKQEILSKQKEMLETQVTERTKEILGQKAVIEEKNKDILDSINYAKRLQDAILPPMEVIKEFFPESFVLYKPKDIVAGDFYWMEVVQAHPRTFQKGREENHDSQVLPIGEDLGGANIFIAAADCTGHGVPGALVSIVCSNALNRTVKEFNITETGKVLDKIRELVLETFGKSDNNVQDGMDISLFRIQAHPRPFQKGREESHSNEALPIGEDSGGAVTLQWSGAYNPLWYMQNGELKEISPDKQPIGKVDNPKPFTTHKLNLQKGDIIYLFTDGYADQFGGPKEKKFKSKQLQELLIANSAKTMEEQKSVLEETLNNWKGNLEQIDDILIIGIRI